MRLRNSWLRARDGLAARGVEEPVLEAEVLHRQALDIDRAEFYAGLDQQLSATQREAVDELLRQRQQGDPLAYVVGRREFYGLEFAVGPAVLIPRQETELLVDKALEMVGGSQSGDTDGQGPLVVDVGTGSGAVAVAVAVHRPQAIVLATDVSQKALRVADVNRRRHGVAERVHLVQTDLLRGFLGMADLIVSNPPYLRTDEIGSLAPELTYEPRVALNGGADGMDVIRRLFRQASSILRPGGRLLVEIAPWQLEAGLEMGRQGFAGATVSFDRDLIGYPRVVSIETNAVATPSALTEEPAMQLVGGIGTL